MYKQRLITGVRITTGQAKALKAVESVPAGEIVKPSQHRMRNKCFAELAAMGLIERVNKTQFRTFRPAAAGGTETEE